MARCEQSPLLLAMLVVAIMLCLWAFAPRRRVGAPPSPRGLRLGRRRARSSAALEGTPYCLQQVCVGCRTTADCGDQLCDPGDHTCKDCLGDGDCHAAGLPRCSAAGACVQCAYPADCPPAAPYCAPSGSCLVCGSDADCAGGYCVGAPDEPRCAPCVPGDATRGCADGTYCVDSGGGAGQCVVCRDSGDCGAGQTCAGGQCWQTCAASSDCPTADPNCINGLCVSCSADADCATSAPFTHCANGLCVQCRSGADCGAGTPYCYRNTCEECSPDDGDADCAGAPGRPLCRRVSPSGAADSYQCVACAANSDCDQVAGAPYCDSTNACVACLADTDCPEGQECTGGGQCVECQTNADCAASPGGRVCADGFCRVCGGPWDCGGATPYCRSDGGACVACATDANCASPTGYCGTSANGAAWGSCVGCTGDSDCASASAPYCDAGASNACVACNGSHPCGGATPICSGGRCIACNTDTDCPAGTPRCHNNACYQCTTTADCPSGEYCTYSNATPPYACLPTPDPCYVWTPYDAKSVNFPRDAAMGNSLMLAAGARPNSGGKWALGYLPTDSRAGTLGTFYGNYQGDSGSGFQRSFVPAEGQVYYLQAQNGCNKTPPQATGNLPVLTFNGLTVCGSYPTWSAVYPGTFSATDSKGNCGQPSASSNWGTYTKVSSQPTPRP